MTVATSPHGDEDRNACIKVSLLLTPDEIDQFKIAASLAMMDSREFIIRTARKAAEELIATAKGEISKAIDPVTPSKPGSAAIGAAGPLGVTPPPRGGSLIRYRGWIRFSLAKGIGLVLRRAEIVGVEFVDPWELKDIGRAVIHLRNKTFTVLETPDEIIESLYDGGDHE